MASVAAVNSQFASRRTRRPRFFGDFTLHCCSAADWLIHQRQVYRPRRAARHRTKWSRSWWKRARLPNRAGHAAMTSAPHRPCQYGRDLACKHKGDLQERAQRQPTAGRRHCNELGIRTGSATPEPTSSPSLTRNCSLQRGAEGRKRSAEADRTDSAQAAFGQAA